MDLDTGRRNFRDGEHPAKQDEDSSDTRLLRLVQIFWRIREGTIDDIVEVRAKPPPNYKTVQTLLRIMERKGQVDHKQHGRAFLVPTTRWACHVHRLSIRHLAAKFFPARGWRLR